MLEPRPKSERRAESSSLRKNFLVAQSETMEWAPWAGSRAHVHLHWDSSNMEEWLPIKGMLERDTTKAILSGKIINFKT